MKHMKNRTLVLLCIVPLLLLAACNGGSPKNGGNGSYQSSPPQAYGQQDFSGNASAAYESEAGDDVYARQGVTGEKDKPVLQGMILKDRDTTSDAPMYPLPAASYENPFRGVRSSPLSTFSIDVDAASYSIVRKMVTAGQLPYPDAVRIEEMINYFTYNYEQPKGKHPFSFTTEVADCPWNKEHKLVHIGLQGKDVQVEKMPPANLVFLIDVSGSMGSPDKLPLLKESFRLLVHQLREEDNISMVVYAGAAGLVLPPTSGAKKEKILSALDRLESGGSTAGAEGIEQAYKTAKKNFIKGGNNRVILATDGDFNVGISSDEELVELIEEKRKEGIFLSILGFGTGNYQDTKMEQLADNGNGNYYYIDGLNEGKRVLVTELGSTLFTIAKDVKLQIEFNPDKVSAYRLIGYENRVLAAKDFHDDTKDAGELGAGHSVTALYEIVPVGAKVGFDISEENNKDYQRLDDTPVLYGNNDLMVVKLRYKQPDKEKSTLIEHLITDERKNLEKASENFKFSTSVAEFGLLLRNSEYKGSATYEQVIALAKSGKGADLNGFRTEFITLVESAEKLANERLASSR